MKILYTFLISYFIPGVGQLFLKDYKKGFIILISFFITHFIIGTSELLNFIPHFVPHILFVIWSISDIYKKVKILKGRKIAKRYLIISLIIVFLLIPIIIYAFLNSLIFGGEYLKNEYLNEDRTKTEMKEINIALDKYKNHYGFYPENYDDFISIKPIRANWKNDNWKTDYVYEISDSINFELVSAGKDKTFNTNDDIRIKNE